jgi:mono/diheme cytochrome c family protein
MRSTETASPWPLWHIVTAAVITLLFAVPWAVAGETASPELIFHNYCSVCHGERGDGNSRARASLDPPPRDFTTLTGLTREAMIAIVTHGKPGTAMVGWSRQLSAQDIEAVVDFIRTTLMPPEPPGLSGIESGARSSAPAPYPNGLVGNAKAGRELYLQACSACHGEKGDGLGPRATIINPKPRAFTDAPFQRGFNRAAVYYAVFNGRPGVEMPAWGRVLSEQQMTDVSEFVYQAFIKPAEGGLR